MADSVTPVTVISPSGATRELTLAAGEPGEWRASLSASELGLWQASDGTLKALINVGPTNPKEFSEVTSTTELLKPLAQASGGDARRVVDGGSLDLPRIVPVRSSPGVASCTNGDGFALNERARLPHLEKGEGGCAAAGWGVACGFQPDPTRRLRRHPPLHSMGGMSAQPFARIFEDELRSSSVQPDRVLTL